MLLFCLQQTARRIPTDEDSHHRSRILGDAQFYREWLYPRIKRFYLKMGWALDDGLVEYTNLSAADIQPRERENSTLSNTSLKSPRCCTPRCRKGGHIKRALGRLMGRKRDTAPITVEDPQVTDGAIQYLTMFWLPIHYVVRHVNFSNIGPYECCAGGDAGHSSASSAEMAGETRQGTKTWTYPGNIIVEVAPMFSSSNMCSVWPKAVHAPRERRVPVPYVGPTCFPR